MIKLPKNVVDDLVKELTALLEKQENSLTSDQIAQVKRDNEVYSKREKDILNKIEELNKDLLEVRARITPDPSEEVVDEARIQEITDMLVLSGYYVKVVKVDGEYLEETGFYEEAPVTAEQVEAEEEKILKIETIEEVIEEDNLEDEVVEEDLVDPADDVEITEDKVVITEE